MIWFIFLPFFILYLYHDVEAHHIPLTGRGKCMHIWDSSNSNSIFLKSFFFSSQFSSSNPFPFFLCGVLFFLLRKLEKGWMACTYIYYGKKMKGGRLGKESFEADMKGNYNNARRIFLHALLFFSHRGWGSVGWFYYFKLKLKAYLV